MSSGTEQRGPNASRMSNHSTFLRPKILLPHDLHTCYCSSQVFPNNCLAPRSSNCCNALLGECRQSSRTLSQSFAVVPATHHTLRSYPAFLTGLKWSRFLRLIWLWQDLLWCSDNFLEHHSISGFENRRCNNMYFHEHPSQPDNLKDIKKLNMKK